MRARVFPDDNDTTRGALRFIGRLAIVLCAVGSSATLSGAGSGQESAVIVRAEAALSRDEPAQAARLLEAALAERPEDPRLLFYLGRAYLEMGRNAEAAEALSRARALRAESRPALDFWEGVALSRLDEAERAMERFEAVLEADPRSEAARLQIGWLLLGQDRPREARDMFAAIVDDHPRSFLAWHYLGVARHGVADLAGAREAYLRSVELSPEFVETIVLLGKVERELGRHEEAESRLERALDLDPDRADAAYELALLELRAGALESALALFERAVAIDPQHAEARYQLGLAYRRVGRILESDLMLAGHVESESARKEVARRELQSAAARTTVARAVELLAAGRSEQAAAAFRAALDAEGSDATATPWLGLGASCLEAGDVDCAIDALERAVDLEPRTAAAHMLLARALDSDGRLDEAAAVLDRWRETVSSPSRR